LNLDRGLTKETGMRLDLTDDQAEFLREVLDIELRELNYEIASADLPSFREKLRARRELLQSILATVGGPIPQVERLEP
jgi:hypothetical protein